MASHTYSQLANMHNTAIKFAPYGRRTLASSRRLWRRWAARFSLDTNGFCGLCPFGQHKPHKGPNLPTWSDVTTRFALHVVSNIFSTQ